MKQKFVLAILMVALLVVNSVAFAAPEKLNFGKQLNAAQCDPNSGKLVINVVQNITNDIDSGVAGNYWAYDNYNRHIQVRQTGTDQFCASVRYQGSFTTNAGPSPQNTGTVTAGVTGTFEGGYTAAITGTLKTVPGASTRGNIGTFNYACTVAGDCPGYVSWLGLYFDPGFSFGYTWWGWIYHGGDNGTWVNATDPPGNSGDIIN